MITAHFELGAVDVEVFCAAPCSEVDSSGTSRIYQSGDEVGMPERISMSDSSTPCCIVYGLGVRFEDETHLDDIPDQVRQDLVLFDLLRILGDLFLHLVLLVQQT